MALINPAGAPMETGGAPMDRRSVAPAQPGQEQPAPGQLPGQEQPPDDEVDDRHVEAVIDLGLQIIYGGKDSTKGEANPAVLRMLREGAGSASADPVQSLSLAAGIIGSRVAQEIVNQQSPIEGAALFAGTMEFIGELADVAKTEGLYDYSQEEINSAAPQAAEVLYTNTQEMGIWDEDEMAQDLSELVQADSDGSLKQQFDTLMPQQGRPQEAAPQQAPPGPQGGMV